MTCTLSFTCYVNGTGKQNDLCHMFSKCDYTDFAQKQKQIKEYIDKSKIRNNHLCELNLGQQTRKQVTLPIITLQPLSRTLPLSQKGQVGKDQEKAQSVKKIPTPKTEVGKNQTNKQVLIP